MQLEIKKPSLPEVIEFNFEELKQELQRKMDHYRGIVYTDDQIKDAKKDLASLRKFTTALSDERIRVKKEWMKPVDSFESKIKELTAIVNEPITLISKQVQEYEEQQKAEKKQKIEAYWHEVLQADKVPAGVKFSDIFNEKMLNASVSMKSIQDDIDASLLKIADDLAVIRNLPSYAFEAEQVYFTWLDLGKAVSEAHRLSEMAERKAAFEAEQARRKAEHAARMEAAELKPTPQPEHVPAQPAPPKKHSVSFRVLLTVEEAKELKAFFEARNIEYEKI